MSRRSSQRCSADEANRGRTQPGRSARAVRTPSDMDALLMTAHRAASPPALENPRVAVTPVRSLL
jgi:hypothetical protein